MNAINRSVYFCFGPSSGNYRKLLVEEFPLSILNWIPEEAEEFSISREALGALDYSQEKETRIRLFLLQEY